MLVKNVYLLYPPGYSGSYINWCINISDLDRFADTVKNPINNSDSIAFGGSGTSHRHLRIPTHQAYTQHVNWVLLNKPTKPNIYIINCAGNENNYVAGQLLQHDATGIIINIHHNNDQLVDSYGAINSAIKWPVRYLAGCALSGDQLPFDPFDCKDNLKFRNWAVTNSWGQDPLDYGAINRTIGSYLDWYRVRNKYHAQEVNKDTYLTQIDLKDRIFQWSCRDVAESTFLDIFSDLMRRSQCSDRFDLAYVNSFHHKYTSAQANLQWFKSVAAWQSTGQLDEYLQSHSIIQARLISLILNNAKINLNYDWQTFYNNIRGTDWPDCNSEDDFTSLPTGVQDEIVTKFNYALPSTSYRNWRVQCIAEINEIYQNDKNNLSVP